MELHHFRQRVLDQLRPAKLATPDTQLYLLYLPEQFDPLAIKNCRRRATQLITAPNDPNTVAPDRDDSPRLIALDCRRVAAYLLESDPALDDPLLEASITQAHAEYCLGQTYNAETDNSTREFSNYSIGGWLLGNEPAEQIASRFKQFSHVFAGPFSPIKPLLRWTRPGFMRALWPTLTPKQRYALLEKTVWFAPDMTSALHRYASAEPTESIAPGPDEMGIPHRLRRFSREQVCITQNVPLVNELLPLCQRLYQEQNMHWPDAGEQQLHHHVRVAQQLGLDANSVAIYGLQAMLLRAGATDDVDWKALMQRSVTQGLPLCDLLGQLPTDFFDRWQLATAPCNPLSQ